MRLSAKAIIISANWYVSKLDPEVMCQKETKPDWKHLSQRWRWVENLFLHIIYIIYDSLMLIFIFIIILFFSPSFFFFFFFFGGGGGDLSILLLCRKQILLDVLGSLMLYKCHWLNYARGKEGGNRPILPSHQNYNIYEETFL